MSRPLFLHVGASKTGTSALQAALRLSQDRLAARGLGLPLPDRGLTVRRLLRPLGWAAEGGFGRPVRPRGLERLSRIVAETPGDVLVVSCEDLAEADLEQVDLLGEVCVRAGVTVHPIVSGRSWARQLPAEYQQLLKVGLGITYADFLGEVRERRGEAGERFVLRQSLSRIADVWARLAPDGRADVVSVPPYGADEDAVYRLFGALVGFELADLTRPDDDINASFGAVEVELLRRLNVTLGDRLPSYEDDYWPAIRRIVVRNAIQRRGSARLTLPPEHLDWVRAAEQADLSTLAAAGHRLHGDDDRLITGPDDVAPLPEFDEAAMAASAVDTLARFAVRTHRDRLRAQSEDQPVGGRP